MYTLFMDWFVMLGCGICWLGFLLVGGDFGICDFILRC